MLLVYTKCGTEDEFTEICAGCQDLICTGCQNFCHERESRHVCNNCNMGSSLHPRCSYCDTVN